MKELIIVHSLSLLCRYVSGRVSLNMTCSTADCYLLCLVFKAMGVKFLWMFSAIANCEGGDCYVSASLRDMEYMKLDLGFQNEWCLPVYG